MPVDPNTGNRLPYKGEPGYDEAKKKFPDLYAAEEAGEEPQPATSPLPRISPPNRSRSRSPEREEIAARCSRSRSRSRSRTKSSPRPARGGWYVAVTSSSARLATPSW